MKGQISFVEYIVSITIFITFAVFFFYNLLSFMPTYLNEIRNERVRSEAYQISELLINDLGEPVNWHFFEWDCDLNRDLIINVEDANAISACWDQPATCCPKCDMNRDGVINLFDAVKWVGLCGGHFEESINRLGLSDENFNKTNLLSEVKIDAIGSNCVYGYENIKKLIGTDLDFTLILIERPSGQARILCSPTQIVTRGINVTVKRIVAFGSSYGELILQVW